MIRTITVYSLLLSSVYFWAQNDSVYTQFTYPAGQISSEGWLVDGRPEGYWKTYYSDGSLKSEGNRKDFELDSLWKFYNNAGLITEEITYRQGRRNGITKRYKEGQLIERCEYVNDTLNGVCEEITDSKVLREIPFVSGKQEGKGYRFNSEEEIVEILLFKAGFLRSSERINRLDKLGRKQGPWKEFYEDRSLKMEGTYVDGEKNGLFKYYDEKGEVSSIEKYENGVLDTEAAEMTVVDIKNEYYPTGAVRSTGSYKDGVKHGVHRDYDEEGNIISSRIYEYGKEIASGIIGRSGSFEGPWKSLYEDGTVKEEGTYKDGLRTDEWRFYHPNGTLIQKGEYRKGKPHGDWTWYYGNGDLRREETYRNGREDGNSVEYDDKGKVLSKGNYIDGQKEGAWEYHIGDHHISGSYVQGEKDGEWKGVYDNGKTQFKGEFQRGFAIGKHKYFYATGQLMQDGKYSSGRKNGEWRRFDEDGEIILRSNFESGIERRLEGVKILPTYEELEID